MESDENYPTHQYTPLEGARHIRIIVLEPARDQSAPLNFSFRQASLAELEDKYEAISYTWGKPNLIIPALVQDGTRLLITKNLDNALRRFRLPCKKRNIWADAVCINQKDHGEKAVQIPLMVHIFKGARRVLVWLGTGDDDGCEEGLEVLSRLWRSPENFRARNLETRRMKTAIISTLSAPWFTRMWVIQEVVFNPDISLFCGAKEISLQRFVSSLAHSQAIAPVPHYNSLSTGFKIWEKNHGISKASLECQGILKLMEDYCQFKCTDDRDRIFALYSMAGDLYQPKSISNEFDNEDYYSTPMRIDYSLTVEETYRVFAEALIHSHKIDSVLVAAIIREPWKSDLEWPSWVPDWRKPPCIRHIHERNYLPRLFTLELDSTHGNRLKLSTLHYAHTTDGFASIIAISNKISVSVLEEYLTEPYDSLALSFMECCHEYFADDFERTLFQDWLTTSPKKRIHGSYEPILRKVIAVFGDWRFFIAGNPNSDLRYYGMSYLSPMIGDKIVIAPATHQSSRDRIFVLRSVANLGMREDGKDSSDLGIFRLSGSAFFLGKRGILPIDYWPPMKRTFVLC